MFKAKKIIVFMPDEGKTKIYENVEFQSNPEVGLLALFPKDGKESIMYSGLSLSLIHI